MMLESALKMLGIKYRKSISDEDLIKLLRKAVEFPASQNEMEIKEGIERLIKLNGEFDKAAEIIEHLKELINYSLWD